ncbi:hypothetical protein K466DRAFT_601799 [Polyporus arcularius HHB13444]|uniref:Uncharacterized protein n=1 Tax=Polyporus arcularius HHB13444 TaxID=1314778 RepID=A0A5C3P5D4_9APHY|nr:hypothetical protein K466DRAFT_601799 [Polyporus arcularius HHB13444]
MSSAFPGARQTRSHTRKAVAPTPTGASAQGNVSKKGAAPQPPRRRQQSIDYEEETPPLRKRPRVAPRPPPEDPVGQEPDEQDPEMADKDPHELVFQADVIWTDSVGKLRSRATADERTEDGTKFIYFNTREMLRNTVHFPRFQRALDKGIKYYEQPSDEHPWANSKGYDDDFEDMQVFGVIVDRFPQFEDHIPYLAGHPETVKRIAKYLTEVLSKVRSDDISRLNKHLIRAIGIPNPNYKLSDKKNRGIKNTATARRLIPPTWFAEFDKDPKAFCHELLSADADARKLTADNLPSFLWNLEKYDRNKPLHGFLQGAPVFAGFSLCFRGPGSVFEECQNNKGQPSIAKMHDLCTVTVESIVYIACIVRHVLSSAGAWGESDGAFSYVRFSRQILNICIRNPKWTKALTDWYQKEMFGDIQGDRSDAVDENSVFAEFMRWDGHEIALEHGSIYEWAQARSDDDDEGN